MKKLTAARKLSALLMALVMVFSIMPTQAMAETPPAEFIPVTGFGHLTNMFGPLTAGTPHTLFATAWPPEATNTAITWSIEDAGTTGATLSGTNNDILNVPSAGEVIVRATVVNGAAIGTDFWRDFSFTVNPAAMGGIIDNSNLTWEFDAITGILTIKGAGPMPNFAYASYQPWWVHRDSITTAVIQYGVTTIGNNAFGVNSLTSAAIPNSVTTIGKSAFSNSNLESVTIPNSVATIGDLAFYGSELTSVTIGNSVTTIGDSAFMWSNLTSVTIPDSVTMIGAWAFAHNPLANVFFTSDAPPTVGNDAFDDVSPNARAIVPSSWEAYGVSDGQIWYGLTIAFYKTNFIPVTGFSHMTGMFGPLTAGTPHTLYLRAWPENATNTAITWSITDAGTTGATLSGTNNDILNVPNAGEVIVRATVVNGAAIGTDFWRDFSFTVNPSQIGTTPDGWQQIGDQWFFYVSGVRVIGWHFMDGSWFYFIPEQNGAAAVGAVAINGVWQYFLPNGAWSHYIVNIDGWHQIGDQWFFYVSGARVIGWHFMDGSWFYFIPEENGAAAVGAVAINGVWQYFHPNGAWSHYIDVGNAPTGWEMMERLGIGINIGNTLDANPRIGGGSLPPNRLDTELSWGETRIEPWHFDAIKLKGFDHVRIPVTWENHIDANGRIYDDWMNRVQEVVDMALARGFYVVLNTHHERAANNSFYQLIDRGYIAEAEAWLVNVWTQILERFGDYPLELIFEPMNEPFRAYHGGWIWTQWPNLDMALIGHVNHLNHVALNLIRSSGGNNAERVVVLTLPGAQADSIPFYNHPNDPFTMLGIFFYPNHPFHLIQNAFNAGIPIYIKETAPIFHIADGQQGHSPLPESIAWITEYFGRFADMGIPTAYWNHETSATDSGWQIFSRRTGEWFAPLVDAIFEAYGREAGPDYTNIPPLFPHELTGGTTDATGSFTFWTPPGGILALADKMIVEYHTPTAFVGGFAFARAGADWLMFDNHHARVSREPGRIIFDMRGLPPTNRLGFAIWGFGHPAQLSHISRVFLDVVAPEGWHFDGNYWFFYQDGARVIGWHFMGGHWFYFIPEQNGAAAVGAVAINGVWQYFHPNGAWSHYIVNIDGWHQIGVQWFFYADGSRVIGWRFMDGAWFYFIPEENGAAAIGAVFVEGRWQYFLPNGAWSHYVN